MEFFKVNTTIPFMRQRMITAFISLIVFIASIVVLSMNGLNLGLDFTGGTQIDVSYTGKVKIDDIRKKLKSQYPKVQVQATNNSNLRVRVSLAKISESDQTILTNNIKKYIPSAHFENPIAVGPSVGSQLLYNGILAVIFSLLLTMIYIAFRFEYRFAFSAAIALIHDPILILGVFSFFHLEFNMVVLTAVLTVIGYSLNDTIVVYDRVRENFRKMRKAEPDEVMDASINQTLSRTIMTSGLTLIVVIALYIYGGDVVHGFSLALIIGILIGTYSSIYVAGSLAIAFGLTRQSLLPKKRFETDDSEGFL
jgi:preprotein translocase subunit SecF